jgi:hypothetical protein
MERLLRLIAGALLDLMAVAEELPWVVLDQLIAWQGRDESRTLS